MRRSSLVLATLLLAGVGPLVASHDTSAAADTAATCKSPIARSRGALYCVHYTKGYALFQTAMTAPNNRFEVRDSGLEAITFPDWIVFVQSTGEVLTVPRDRLVYVSDTEFGDDQK